MRLPIIFCSVATLPFVISAPQGVAIHERAAATRNVKPNLTHGSALNIHQSRALIAPRVYNQNQAGAVILRPPEGDKFTSITGTFTVPTIALPRGGNAAAKYSASIWLGIANNRNQDAVLQGGITMALQGTASSFFAWSGWTPDKATNVSATDFAVASGDSVTITVTSTSVTEGTVVLDNVTTGKKVTKAVTAPSSVDPTDLTAQSVDVMVEGYQVNGGLPDLVDFTRVQFTKVTAGTASGQSIGVTGSGLYEVQTTSGQVLTKTTVPEADQVLVTFIK